MEKDELETLKKLVVMMENIIWLGNNISNIFTKDFRTMLVRMSGEAIEIREAAQLLYSKYK